MSTSYEISPCPACRATDITTVVSRDEIRDEIEQLWEFHTRRLRGDTPPMLLHDRIAFSQRPPVGIARCGTCSLVFRHPRERGDLLLELYNREAPDERAMRALFDNQRRNFAEQVTRLTRVFGGTGRGLEVGSYIGAFLDAANEADWSFVGVDVNAVANAFARAHSHDVIDGTIDDVPIDAPFDVIAFWNCFDQLPDPAAAAIAARERLRAGGMLALRVPNGDFYLRWRKRLDAHTRPLARAALAHNNLLGFPYRHGFTLRSLQQLLERAGFSMQHCRAAALVPLADQWTHGWAAIEERLVKSALAALPPAHAPWLEVYARTAGHTFQNSRGLSS